MYNLAKKLQRLTSRCAAYQVFKRVRKTAITFVISAYLSVRPHGITRLPLGGFLRNFMFEYFSTICPENSRFIKI